jgi:predicted alpha/beta hydrolase
MPSWVAGVVGAVALGYTSWEVFLIMGLAYLLFSCISVGIVVLFVCVALMDVPKKQLMTIAFLCFCFGFMFLALGRLFAGEDAGWVSAFVWQSSCFFAGAGSCLLAFALKFFVIRALVLPALLPSMIQDRVFAPEIKKQQREACLKGILEENALQWARVAIRTDDGVTLDGAEYIASPATDKWVIWFLGNGGFFEVYLPMLEDFGCAVGANVLAFNYRGVGSSEGFPESEYDVIQDGVAAMKHVLCKDGVDNDEKKVLLYGHSLGGGIAAFVRAKYPSGAIISDRSFSRIANVPKSWLVHLPVPDQYKKKLESGLDFLLASVWRWDLHAFSQWRRITGHKMIIYAKDDEVISHSVASLYTSVKQLLLGDAKTQAKEKLQVRPNRLRLCVPYTDNTPSPHNTNITQLQSTLHNDHVQQGKAYDRVYTDGDGHTFTVASGLSPFEHVVCVARSSLYRDGKSAQSSFSLNAHSAAARTPSTPYKPRKPQADDDDKEAEKEEEVEAPASPAPVAEAKAAARPTLRRTPRRSVVNESLDLPEALVRNVITPTPEVMSVADELCLDDPASPSIPPPPPALLPQVEAEEEAAAQASAEEAARAEKAQEAKKIKTAKMAVKRTRVIQELLSTEITYVKNLDILTNTFMAPLLADPKKYGLDNMKINHMFSNVAQLHTLHKNLLENLKADDGKTVGKKLAHLAPFLRMYTQFVTDYDRSLEEFEAASKHKKFKTFLQRKQTELGSGLMNFLITPVQRIPRYELLLKEIKKYCPPDHAEYKDLNECLELIKDIGMFINERKRKVENMSRLYAIQHRIGDSAGEIGMTLVQFDRTLLLETELSQMTSSGMKSFKLTPVLTFVFNDMVLYVDQKKENYKGHVAFAKAVLEEDLSPAQATFLSSKGLKGGLLRDTSSANEFFFACSDAQEEFTRVCALVGGAIESYKDSLEENTPSTSPFEVL